MYKLSSMNSQSLTVDAFQQHIHRRYYETDRARGTPATFMWFIEEVGELATALGECGPDRSPTPAQLANLGEEFADVLAWLATLANVADVDLASVTAKYTAGDGVPGVKP